MVADVARQPAGWQRRAPVERRAKRIGGRALLRRLVRRGRTSASCRRGAAACSRRSCRRSCSTSRASRRRASAPTTPRTSRAARAAPLETLGYPAWGLSPEHDARARRAIGEYGAQPARRRSAIEARRRHAARRPRSRSPSTRRRRPRTSGGSPSASRVYGDFGFYDAVDPQTGAVAHAYLALDQSMIFLAAANCLHRRRRPAPLRRRPDRRRACCRSWPREHFFD